VVGDLAALVEYIMLLPGKTAAFLARAATVLEEGWAAPRPAVVPELVELPGGLAELLGKSELPKVRKVPGELKYALADIGAALLDKDQVGRWPGPQARGDFAPRTDHRL